MTGTNWLDELNGFVSNPPWDLIPNAAMSGRLVVAYRRGVRSGGAVADR
jgi:hypothetical protein